MGGQDTLVDIGPVSLLLRDAAAYLAGRAAATGPGAAAAGDGPNLATGCRVAAAAPPAEPAVVCDHVLRDSEGFRSGPGY